MPQVGGEGEARTSEPQKHIRGFGIQGRSTRLEADRLGEEGYHTEGEVESSLTFQWLNLIRDKTGQFAPSRNMGI
jgi:hypothetical protein